MFSKTITCYKLFKVRKGELYPLFVKFKDGQPFQVGEWEMALSGEKNPITGKVKSSLGDLAYRPGFHAGDVPVALHIGGKSRKGLKKPDYRKKNQVWCEVEVPAIVDWQSIANKNGTNKSGKIVAKNAAITDCVPYAGYYKFKTNSNMYGSWIISGNMKILRVLTDKEVFEINSKTGVHDLPRK